MLRDELRAIDDPSAVRLATQIDVAATMLLAAPLHAGVRCMPSSAGVCPTCVVVAFWRKRDTLPIWPLHERVCVKP